MVDALAGHFSLCYTFGVPREYFPSDILSQGCGAVENSFRIIAGKSASCEIDQNYGAPDMQRGMHFDTR